MTHADAIRLLHTLADMLNNERVLADECGDVIRLRLSQDRALAFENACGHAARVLATLREEPEE